MGERLSIGPATGAADLAAVRGLITSFVAWHRARHVDDLALIDAYFDPVAFAAELDALPGRYGPPRGRLLLARRDGEPAGCVALRQLEERSAELKRMFVHPDLQGKGVGRLLGRAILDEAVRAGFRCVYLDTSVREIEALALYRNLGFEVVAPYYPVSDELAAWLVFMRLELPAFSA
jgi:GNAT superfamily N-acetyltransferase